MVSSSLRCEEGAEAGRRLRQPVDLLLERHDLVARLAQRLGEPLVLRGHRGQRALGVGQPLLEAAGLAGRVGQPAAQVGDLGLEEAAPGSRARRRSRVRRSIVADHASSRPPPREADLFDPTARGPAGSGRTSDESVSTSVHGVDAGRRARSAGSAAARAAAGPS